MYSTDIGSALVTCHVPERSILRMREEKEFIKRILRCSIDNPHLRGFNVRDGDRGSKSPQHHHIAHMACHGVSQTGTPPSASFRRRDDNHLTILDVVRTRLPAAEFVMALFFVCHTAELTDGSIANEALHLTSEQHTVDSPMWLGRRGR